MMHGTIISKAGDYGFILCAEGVAHYFNSKLLGAGVSFDDLGIGAPVCFEPVAGPKGMRAKQVSPREMQYGWTTGQFLVLKGDAFIPDHNVDELEPPVGDGERFTTSWAEFIVPFHGDQDPVMEGVIERAREAGANAVDMLKVETRTLQDGNAKGTWQALTGRIVFYHCSVEIASDEQYYELINEHNQLYQSVLPEINALQARLDAENNRFQLHSPRVIGDQFLTLAQGEKLDQGKSLFCGVTVTTPWYRDYNTGKQELLTQAKNAGANCITELTRLEQAESDGNYKYTMYSWVGHAGVWGRHKQVFDQQESDRIEAENKAHCDAVHGRLLELKLSLDMRREDFSFLSGTRVLVVVVVIVAVVLLAFI
jgi:uncharacterized protein YbjQ (UPF0145 family)/cold shock CspA family protein